jgi:hypothetical protein
MVFVNVWLSVWLLRRLSYDSMGVTIFYWVRIQFSNFWLYPWLTKFIYFACVYGMWTCGCVCKFAQNVYCVSSKKSPKLYTHTHICQIYNFFDRVVNNLRKFWCWKFLVHPTRKTAKIYVHIQFVYADKFLLNFGKGHTLHFTRSNNFPG